MSLADWATTSDRAVMFAGILYAIAFVAHIVEWAVSRTAKPALVGAGELESGGLATDERDGSASATAPELNVRAETFGRVGVAMTVIGAGLHLLGLVARALATDPVRVPWGNMYEFTLAGTFGVAVIYLLLLRKYHLRWLGMIVTGFLISTLMLDTILLYKEAGPVMPSLQSYWLVIHVFAAIAAAGAFAVGAMLSVIYLWKESAIKRGKLRPGGVLDKAPSLDSLDRLSYRLHAIGFPVWTFGALIAGPIWARQAWSSYWSWDPKEVWAFITWVVYAGYLHARATAGYRGKVAAIIALIGFATLLFNFVGINFFFGGSSMHSYAGG